MSDLGKLLAKAQSGPNNLTYGEFCRLLELLAFVARKQRGTSHQTFKHPSVPKVFTVQGDRHGKAVGWQVKRLLDWIDEYGLLSNRPADDN